MNICDPNNIRIIPETECLSESINTINTNFETLSSITCQLKERVESIRMSRTFLYNADNFVLFSEGSTLLPSDFTISTFVNSPFELDLGAISYPGDTAYVVYQTTRYRVTPATTTLSQIDLSPRATNFLPSSSQIILRTAAQRSPAFKPKITAFNFYKVNQTGRRLNTPDIRPSTIKNDKNSQLRAFYLVEWEVKNSGRANMAAGNYSFEFSLPPGGSLNFSNRMSKWLRDNIGRDNVRIAGIITRSGQSSIIPRRVQEDAIDPFLPPEADTDLEFIPVMYVWKLTYEDRPGRGLNYYINNGWPKIHRAQTPVEDNNNINWNRPDLWTTYESW